MPSKTEESDEKDVLRETPIRLLGYANEVGEAFRPLVHRNVVRFSYGVAFGYCIADTLNKAVIAHKKESDEKGKAAFSAAVDAFVWQTLASVAIPGFTINRICWASLRLLSSYSQLSKSGCKWSAVVASISCIPLIMKPIDSLVDTLLDNSLRVLTRTQ